LLSLLFPYTTLFRSVSSVRTEPLKVHEEERLVSLNWTAKSKTGDPLYEVRSVQTGRNIGRVVRIESGCLIEEVGRSVVIVCPRSRDHFYLGPAVASVL